MAKGGKRRGFSRRLASLRSGLGAEWALGAGVATAVFFAFAGERLFDRLGEPLWFALIFAWLFAILAVSTLAVVRHADHVAEALGEPLGTLILTLSITTVEVLSISAVMLHGANNPTLVRDTLFAIVMIILGGMVGASLLFGGLRHREQHYNLQGANAYLGVIIPLAMLTLSLPNFTVSTAGPTLSLPQQVFLATVAIGLYIVFLAIQTGRHRGYFSTEEADDPRRTVPRRSAARHAALLIAYIASIVFLAEHLARPIDHLIETLRLPTALGGIVIAVLVAMPEAVGATRAALANRLQRAINIFLGSVLSTMGLSVPVMLAVSYVTDHPVLLGLEGANNFLLMTTLAVSVVTFASGRTNVLQGAVHVVLFAAFLMLVFDA